MRRIVGILCAGLALAAPAHGSPTGLNIIPTADVLPAGTASVEGEVFGPGGLPARESEPYALLQVGFPGRLEAGVDRGIGGAARSAAGNVKWQVLPQTGVLPALALGAQNISGRQRIQPYLAATRSLGRTRIHAGLLRDDAGTHLLAGVEHAIGTRLVVQGDHVGGSGGISSAGVALQVHRRASLTLAVTRAAGARRLGHILNLAVLLGP